MINGYMVNMWLMLIYSNYLNLTVFRYNKSMTKFFVGKLIAFIPWIISMILLFLNWS